MKIKTYPIILILLGVMMVTVQAGELVKDTHTLLLLHFDHQLTGADGEVPLAANGVSYEPGMFGAGARFAAVNDVQFASAGNIDSQAGTLEFWIKPAWPPDDGLWHYVLGFGGYSGMLFGKDSNNFWRCILNRFGGSGDPEMGTGLFLTDEWVAGEWHHAAFTWDSEFLRVFIDGELREEVPVAYPLPLVTASTVYLGSDQGHDGIEAVIDELRISDIARSVAEIRADYEEGLISGEFALDPDTLLLLHFNDSLVGTDGEAPLIASGTGFDAGVFGGGVTLGAINELAYSGTDNIDSQAGTLEFWIKPRWEPDDDLAHMIFSFGGATGILFGKDTANFWRCIFNRYGGSGDPEMGTGLFLTTEWSANEWHHAAFTWDSEFLRVFIDGELRREVPVAYPLPLVTASTFYLGSDLGASGIDAVVDELRLSRRARSLTEIREAYAAGLALARIAIEPAALTLLVGETFIPDVLCQNLIGEWETVPAEEINWSSDNPDVADVDAGGMIVANSPGTAVVTAEYDGFSARIEITANAAPMIPAWERAALIDLYQSTGGDEWTNHSGWKTPPLAADGFALPGTEGQWYGIGLTPDGLNVNQLFFPLNNLVGNLPESIGDLGWLQRISMGSNALTGPIPATIGNLPDLQLLILACNRLSGPIPSTIRSCGNLRWLMLNENELHGSLSYFTDMTFLEELYLDGVTFAEPIPPELNRLTQLRILGLERCELTGEIPPELFDLTSLETLRLNINRLEGTFPDQIGQLTQLRYLFMEENNLSGLLPETIGDLSLLLALRINGNQFVGPIPNTILQLTRLNDNSSRFEYNGLVTADESLAAFLDQKQVSSVSWEDTQTVAPANVTAIPVGYSAVTLTWDPIAYLADPGYYDVVMAADPGGPFELVGSTPDKYTCSITISGLQPDTTYWYRVRSVTDAHELNANTVVSLFGDAAVATTGLFQVPDRERQALIALYQSTGGDNWINRENWKNPDDPTQFNLPGTECTWYGVTCGETPDGLSVVSVNLADNNLAGTIPERIVDLSRLTELVLSRNSLGGPFPAGLWDLSELRVLDLGENPFNTTLPEDLAGLHSLEALLMCQCGLSGPIPAAIGTLTGLRLVHLQFNDMTGSLDQFLPLTNLEQLILSDNDLSGPIPPELVDLAGLWQLILSNCNLRGAIPEELCGLDLEELSLDGNRLAGAIPTNLGNLVHLRRLNLAGNDLEGVIPFGIDQLSELALLDVSWNLLDGPLPDTMLALDAVPDFALCLNFNKFYTFNPELTEFLNAHSYCGDWQDTQTVGPDNVVANPDGSYAVTLTWDPIRFRDGDGYYEITWFRGDDPGQTFSMATPDKYAAEIRITGLAPAMEYAFRIRTVSTLGDHVLISGYSEEVRATVSSCQAELAVDFPSMAADGCRYIFPCVYSGGAECPALDHVRVQWGDGSEEYFSPPELTFTLEHVYYQSGVMSPRIMACDADGRELAGAAGVIEVVTCCQPGMAVGFPPTEDPQSYVDGCHVQINGGVAPGSNPDCPEIVRIHWDWGDGRSNDSWFPAGHDYPAPGVYAVVVTAYDADGNSDRVIGQVRVDESCVNLPPFAEAGPVLYANEGETVTLVGEALDPDGTVVGMYWDLDGDGVYDDAEGLTVQWLFEEDGVWPIGFRVVDNNGAVAMDGTSVVVANLPPVLEETFLSAHIFEESTPVEVNVTFRDPGIRDTHEYLIEWGDGATTSGSVAGADPVKHITETHAYDASILPYPITVSVWDDDGAVGMVHDEVRIINPSWITEPDPQNPGNPVTVIPEDPVTGENPVVITFSQLEKGGITTVESVPVPDITLPPPANFMLSGAALYDINSSALFTSPVTICLSYDDTRVQDETSLRLYHLAESGWEDITAVDVSPNPDPDVNLIFGRTDSFSLFALLEPLRLQGPADPVEVGTNVGIRTVLSDLTHVDAVEWDWGDGIVEPGIMDGNEVSATHVYQMPGVYIVTLRLLANGEERGSAELRYVVVFDPDGGFVSGGGWIDSPVGAYLPDPELTGRANFGFVSKYKKGTVEPIGQTQFLFHAAALEFHSTSYQWLVIAGSKAMYKGTGTLNGGGDFGFILMAIDGDLKDPPRPDCFRIKIWDRFTGEVIYDNQLDAPEDADPVTALGGGSIVIHKK